MDWVVEELNYAQQYARPVLPVLLGVPMPDYTTLPPECSTSPFATPCPVRRPTWMSSCKRSCRNSRTSMSSHGPRNTLAGSSRHQPWRVGLSHAVRQPRELARVVERCIAGGAAIKTRSDDYARIFGFGSKGGSRIWGTPLTRPEDLPVDFQVRVRTGPGGALVEARCDEALGQACFLSVSTTRRSGVSGRSLRPPEFVGAGSDAVSAPSLADASSGLCHAANATVLVRRIA